MPRSKSFDEFDFSPPDVSNMGYLLDREGKAVLSADGTPWRAGTKTPLDINSGIGRRDAGSRVEPAPAAKAPAANSSSQMPEYKGRSADRLADIQNEYGSAGAGAKANNVGTAGQDKRIDSEEFQPAIRSKQSTSGAGKKGSGAAASMNTGMGRRDAGYSNTGASAGNPSGYGDMGGPGSSSSAGVSGTDLAKGIAAAAIPTAAAGAAAWKAKKMADARAEDARAKRVAETKRSTLADQARAAVESDRAARTPTQDRVAMDEEIKRELKKGQTKAGPGTPDRSAVLNKDAWREGPSTDKKITTLGKTVVNETPAQTKARNTSTSRGNQGGVSSAELDEISQKLRESRATTTKADASAKAGKVAKGLGKAALVPVLASITSLVKAGQYKEATALAAEVGLTPWQVMAGEAGAPTLYDQREGGRAATAEEIETEKKKPGAFQQFKDYIVAKKAGGGQIKAAPVKRMASGGMTSKVSSASSRGDGIASRGKTRGRVC